MRKRRRRKNIWAEYERRKRSLAQRPQPSAQYEADSEDHTGDEDMSGRHSQRKGAEGERELATVLQEYGYEIKRGGVSLFWGNP